MTVAESNKKLIQDIYAGLAKGDSSLFRASLADDVVVRLTGSNSWSRSFHGKDALFRELYGYLRTVVRDYPGSTVADHIYADGDHVIVEARGAMTSTAGVPYRNEYCLVYRLREGKIVEFREYLDSVHIESVLGPYPKPGETAVS